VLLKSIVALAHDLNMEVVAEGAETDSDAVELYQLGCEYAQGFAFGEPMDADATMRLLTGEKVQKPRTRRQSLRSKLLSPAASPATAPSQEDQSTPAPESGSA
jgi:predicted signal transduction protein with EAL and GGDEF domain